MQDFCLDMEITVQNTSYRIHVTKFYDLNREVAAQ